MGLQLIGVDSVTGGNWIGKYGKSGYLMFYNGNNWKQGVCPWMSSYASTTGQSLVPDATITGNPWYLAIPGTANGSGSTILTSGQTVAGGRLIFSDLLPHRISMYYACLDGIARTQTVSFQGSFVHTISIAANVGVWCNYLITAPAAGPFLQFSVTNSATGVVPSFNGFMHDVYRPAIIGGFNFGSVGAMGF